MNYGEVLFSLEKRIQNAIRRLGPTNAIRWKSFCGFDEMTVSQFTERANSLNISVNLEEVKAIWRKRGINKDVIKYKDFIALLSNWNWSKYNGDFSPVCPEEGESCRLFVLPENNPMVRSRLFDAFRQLDKYSTGFVSTEDFDAVALDFSISYDDISMYDTKHDGTFNYLLFLSRISENYNDECFNEFTNTKQEKKPVIQNISTRRDPHAALISPAIDKNGPELKLPSSSSSGSGSKSKTSPKNQNEKSEEKKEKNSACIALIAHEVLNNGRSPMQYYKDNSFGGKLSLSNLMRNLNLTLESGDVLFITEEYGDPMTMSSFMRLVSDGKNSISSKDEYVKKPFLAAESEAGAVVKWLSEHSSVNDFSFLKDVSTPEQASKALKERSIFISPEDIAPAIKVYGSNLFSAVQSRGKEEF